MTTFHSRVQVEIAHNINLYAETLQCVWWGDRCPWRQMSIATLIHNRHLSDFDFEFVFYLQRFGWKQPRQWMVRNILTSDCTPKLVRPGVFPYNKYFFCSFGNFFGTSAFAAPARTCCRKPVLEGRSGLAFALPGFQHPCPAMGDPHARGTLHTNK